MNSFKYELGAAVKLGLSNEAGHVDGRAEYRYGENQYYVIYCAADGRQVTAWWGESQLDPAPL